MANSPYVGSGELKAKWFEVEERLKSIVCIPCDCPLSTRRVGGKVRLCYHEIPIAEVSTAEQVTASTFLPEFIKFWERERDRMPNDIAKATAKVSAVLDQLGKNSGK